MIASDEHPSSALRKNRNKKALLNRRKQPPGVA